MPGSSAGRVGYTRRKLFARFFTKGGAEVRHHGFLGSTERVPISGLVAGADGEDMIA